MIVEQGSVSGRRMAAIGGQAHAYANRIMSFDYYMGARFAANATDGS
jgi:hypothetical protein